MNVFISYRRENSSGHAGRLADHLAARFGSSAVFIDVSSIDAGSDFVETIERTITRADVVLVVIGPDWQMMRDRDGDRRLWDSRDPVRVEIETALASEARTIPVLVGGATMPSLDSVPESIHALTRLNAVELLDRRWAGDVADLVDLMHRRGVSRPGPGSLPVALSSFVGRRELLEVAAEALTDHRLLTLTGAGGSGKTRAALELARRWRDDGRPTWFVGLASVRDAANTADAVLATLGISARGEEGLDAAVRSLRLHPGLLVIDNCEHVRASVADLIARLIAEVSDLRVVATSREPLELEGERIFVVHPLELPSPGIAMDRAMENEAVRLFVDRASASSPFSLTEKDLGAVIDICARVAGLPLGIELAAARVRSLPVQEIASRLSDRQDLLSTSREGHHATMAAAIDWSVDLLAPDERRLFERLAIFDAPFPIEAAERVGGDPGGIQDVVRGVAALVDKSLMVMEHVEIGTRYRYLEPIRQRAEVLLGQGGEFGSASRKHAEWTLELTDQAETGLRGPEQHHWVARLSASLPDVRKALAWPPEEHTTDHRVRIVSNLWWLMPNLDFDEWGKLLDQVTGTAGPADPGWPFLLAATALQAMFALDLQRAEDLAREVLRSAPRASVAAMMSSTIIGSIQRERGELASAAERHKEDESVARAASEPWWEARARYSCGLVRIAGGDLAEASRDLEVSVQRFIRIGEPSSILDCYQSLYAVAKLGGDEEKAASAVEGMDPWVDRALPENAALAAICRAELALHRDDVSSALALAMTGVERSMVLGTANDVSMNALEVVAACLAREGRHERAIELVASGESFLPMDKRFGSDFRRGDRERLLVDAREALGQAVFARAWNSGTEARFEDVLASI